jgi:hypothetical protein
VEQVVLLVTLADVAVVVAIKASGIVAPSGAPVLPPPLGFPAVDEV